MEIEAHSVFRVPRLTLGGGDVLALRRRHRRAEFALA